MKAIILVAGYATRLYPLTKNTPKPLLQVGGKAIIDYIVEEINTLDAVDEIYVVSNHKFAKNFEEWAKEINNVKPITVIDDGTSTVSCFAVLALRILVSISAIGSLIVI